jgi:hypothetical protein
MRGNINHLRPDGHGWRARLVLQQQPEMWVPWSLVAGFLAQSRWRLRHAVRDRLRSRKATASASGSAHIQTDLALADAGNGSSCGP